MSSYNNEKINKFIEKRNITKQEINPTDILLVVDGKTEIIDGGLFSSLLNPIEKEYSCANSLYKLNDNLDKFSNVKLVITSKILSDVYYFDNDEIRLQESTNMPFAGGGKNTYFNLINKAAGCNKLSIYESGVSSIISVVSKLTQTFPKNQIICLTSKDNMEREQENFKGSNVTIVDSFKQLEKYLEEKSLKEKFYQNLIRQNSKHTNIRFHF